MFSAKYVVAIPMIPRYISNNNGQTIIDFEPLIRYTMPAPIDENMKPITFTPMLHPIDNMTKPTNVGSAKNPTIEPHAAIHTMSHTTENSQTINMAPTTFNMFLNIFFIIVLLFLFVFFYKSLS